MIADYIGNLAEVAVEAHPDNEHPQQHDIGDRPDLADRIEVVEVYFVLAALDVLEVQGFVGLIILGVAFFLALGLCQYRHFYHIAQPLLPVRLFLSLQDRSVLLVVRLV